jgi:hypothetical protein
LQAVVLGAIARCVYDQTGVDTANWTTRLRYTRTVLVAMFLSLAGVGLAAPLVWSWTGSGFTLSGDVTSQTHLAVLGIVSFIAGFVLFTSTLLLHAVVNYTQRRP